MTKPLGGWTGAAKRIHELFAELAEERNFSEQLRKDKTYLWDQLEQARARVAELEKELAGIHWTEEGIEDIDGNFWTWPRRPREVSK